MLARTANKQHIRALGVNLKAGKLDDAQAGINMVDLMMWLVIAALLLAAALQGIGYYQKAAWTYQVQSDVRSTVTWASGAASIKGKAITNEDLLKALNSGDLKMTSTGGVYNNAMISTPDGNGTAVCVGVRANKIQPPNNVFYATSKEPSTVVQASEMPASCGTYSETALNEAGDGSGFIMDGNLVSNSNATSLDGWSKHAGAGATSTLTLEETGGPTAQMPSFVRETWTKAFAPGQAYGTTIENAGPNSGIIKPNTAYKQTVWVRSNQNINVYVDAIVLDKNNAVVQDSIGSGNVALQAGVWKQITADLTGPSNSYRAAMRVVTNEGEGMPVGAQLDVTGFVLSVK